MATTTYRRLLAAQLIALVGTGVTTVALGLLAYDLAGEHAGAVLGAALALKMVAYVGFSPVIAALAHRVDRRRLLISLDLVRAAVLVSLPFVTHVWEVFALVFVVSACAAGFTPAFNGTLLDVLPDEDEYTRALSFSRAAYDLADLLSPVLAAGLLLVTSFHALFAVNAVSFVASALLIASITLPGPRPGAVVSDRTLARVTLGARRFLGTPRLRGLLALDLAAAAASAMVIVNTVVLVRGPLGLGATDVALALGASGAGSIVTSLSVPRILRAVDDRSVMLAGAAVLGAGLLLVQLVDAYWELLALWVVLGAGLALVQTPIGRLIARSAPSDERPPLFAAQFALSHLCWLLTYPVAGVLGASAGVGPIAAVLGVVALASAAVAAVVWRRGAPAAAV